MNQITLNKKAQKQLKNLPVHIVRKLQMWAEQVEMLGILEIRKISGYHDEPLQGDRKGQRSIRLSKAYRAFYIEHSDDIIIEVIEVNKHDY
jgi:proteic killer suppression protein